MLRFYEQRLSVFTKSSSKQVYLMILGALARNDVTQSRKERKVNYSRLQ